MLCAVLGDPDLAQHSQPLQHSGYSVVACEFWIVLRQCAFFIFCDSNSSVCSQRRDMCDVSMKSGADGFAVPRCAWRLGWVLHLQCRVVALEKQWSTQMLRGIGQGRWEAIAKFDLALGESFEDLRALQLRLMHAMPNTLRWEEVLDVNFRSLWLRELRMRVSHIEMNARLQGVI